MRRAIFTGIAGIVSVLCFDVLDTSPPGVDRKDNTDHPWNGAELAAQGRVDIATEREADASGLLANDDESSSWYVRQASNVVKTNKEHEQHERQMLQPSPTAGHKEEEYLRLAKSATAKQHLDELRQLQSAVNIEHAKKVQEVEQQQLFKDATPELGEAAMIHDIEHDVVQRARRAARKRHDLDVQGDEDKHMKVKEREQKHDYVREVQRLGEARDEKVKAEAVKSEGRTAEVLDQEAAAAQAEADIAAKVDDDADASLKNEENDMLLHHNQATVDLHAGLMAKFQELSDQATSLVRQGTIIDEGAKGQDIRNMWLRYAMDIKTDEESSPDAKIMYEYALRKANALKNLPNVAQAETSIDPATHPCGATDTLNQDPLCTLVTNVNEVSQEMKASQIHHLSDTLGRTESDPVDNSDVVALELNEGQGVNDDATFATLHASTADQRYIRQQAAWNKKYHAKARNLDAAVERELGQLQRHGKKEATAAWHIAQDLEAKEMKHGVLTENIVPRVMARTTKLVLDGARRYKNQEEKIASSAEQQALHRNYLQHISQVEKLGRSVAVAEQKQEFDHLAANAQVRNELRRLQPHLPLESEMSSRTAAAHSIALRQKSLQQAILMQDQERAFQQAQELKTFDLAKVEMAEESQHIVDNSVQP